jgi:uncharacterized protein (DUF2236 family)
VRSARPELTAERITVGSISVSNTGADEDRGLFGRESVTWRVHADASMLVGGIRALLLQSLHPLVMAGVAVHSEYLNRPWERFERTVSFISTVTYGTTTEALGAIASVRRVHERVVGRAPDGRWYTAADPELLAWVYGCSIDSFLRAYLRYGAHLDRSEQDQYVREASRVGELLGVTDPPRDRDELTACVSDRPCLTAGAQARQAVRFLLFPPLRAPARLAYAVAAAAAVELLPQWARRKLRLPVLPLTGPLLVRPAALALLTTLRVMDPDPAVLASAWGR